MTDSVKSDKAPEPVGPYPHARKVGNLLFLSGIGPRKPGMKTIPGVELDKNGNILSYNIVDQCRSVFENVRNILEDAGSHWDNLVDITVFLTNMKNDFKKFNDIYNLYFPEANVCRTTVEVNALPTDIAIELKCIALINK